MDYLSQKTVMGAFNYNYDNNSNIIEKSENGTTENYSYDSLDRVSTSTNGNQSYGFDGKGNRLTLSSELTIPVNTSEYEYDEFNRLTQVKQDGKVIGQYKYNGDNLLIEATQEGVTTRYYYDGDQIIAEGIVGASGQVSLKARYLRAGDKLVNREDSTGVKGYYLHNGHGDVVEIRNQSGNLLNSYSYDIWGNPTTTKESIPNPFQYSGELWDKKTSLQYLRARWYDPSLGRFITEDTYEGEVENPQSLNLYTYVLNNPLRYTDPSGNNATNPTLEDDSDGGDNYGKPGRSSSSGTSSAGNGNGKGGAAGGSGGGKGGGSGSGGGTKGGSGGSTKGSKGKNGGSSPLPSTINLKSGTKHVTDRHMGNKAGWEHKSKWTVTNGDWKTYTRNTFRKPDRVSTQSDGNLVYEEQYNKVMGVDKNGNRLYYVRVVVDKAGNLVTSFQQIGFK